MFKTPSAYTVEMQKPSPSAQAGQEGTLLKSKFPESSPECRSCRGQRSQPCWVRSSPHTSTLAATHLAVNAASSCAGWGGGGWMHGLPESSLEMTRASWHALQLETQSRSSILTHRSQETVNVNKFWVDLLHSGR